MILSKQQVEHLRLCKDGIRWHWFLDRERDDVMHYLMDNGLVASRVDISDGLVLITQKSISELEQIENEENIDRQREQDKKKQAKSEAVKAEQYIAEERAHNVKIAGLSAVLGGIFGNIQYLIELCLKLIRSFRG